ncbi:MAG: hypothetical protein AABW63_01780 [Nanoarchaeota archaeon]
MKTKTREFKKKLDGLLGTDVILTIKGNQADATVNGMLTYRPYDPHGRNGFYVGDVHVALDRGREVIWNAETGRNEIYVLGRNFMEERAK